MEGGMVRRVLLWSRAEMLDYMMALESPLEGALTGPARSRGREG